MIQPQNFRYYVHAKIVGKDYDGQKKMEEKNQKIFFILFIYEKMKQHFLPSVFIKKISHLPRVVFFLVQIFVPVE